MSTPVIFFGGLSLLSFGLMVLGASKSLFDRFVGPSIDEQRRRAEAAGSGRHLEMTRRISRVVLFLGGGLILFLSVSTILGR